MNYERFDSFIMALSGSICYICDTESYELLHLTKPGMDVYGFTDPEQYRGKKCYEVLQGRTSPCPFCTNHRLSEGKDYRWEHYNDKLQRWFDITDTLVQVEGRLCRLEIARDITARKAGSQSEHLGSMSMEDVLFRCLHVLAAERDMKAAVDQFLSNVGSYYKAARTYIFEFDFINQTTNNTFEWCGPGVSREIEHLQNIPLEVVADWIRIFETGGAFAISSVDEERDPDSEEVRLLQMQGIQSLLAAPLIRDKQIVGFIGVDDPEQNSGNPGLLKGVSEFILAELERRRLLEELAQLSYTDILTGVSNRNGYRQAVSRMQAVPPACMGVMIFSINGLKIINENLGQKYGDDVIVRTADRLRSLSEGQVYRIGGDEFALFCPEISRSDFEAVVKRLQDAFRQEQEYSVSMGYDWEAGGADVTDQMLRAEEWMRAQKQRYYHDEISKGRKVGDLADDLLADIRENRFAVWYQPQIDLRTGLVTGMEALVRKVADDGSIIPPSQFVPVYEARNVLQHLDQHVLDMVLEDLKTLYAQGLSVNASVNFSRSTLLNPDFARCFTEKCRACGVPPSAITVEVTETISNIEREALRELLDRMRQTGLKLSLDDFGTEYSNLSILTDVPFDEVKFDKSLVDNICTSGRSQIVLGRLMQMCRQLQQSRIVAEGIEDAGQVEILKSYGCDCGQGYYFHKPMPFEDIKALLESRKSFETAQVIQTSDSFLSGQDYQLRHTLEEVLLQLINGGSDLYGYRIEGRRGLFSRQLAQGRNIPEQVYDFPKWIVDHGQVSEDSIGDWLGLFASIHRGDKHGSARVSFQVGEGEFHKYYLRFNSFADEEGNPFFATISFENVELEQQHQRQQSQDIAGLLQATQKNFPEILTLNLTKGTYRMYSYYSNTTVGTPREGMIEDMIALRVNAIVREDREVFMEAFSRSALQQSIVVEKKDSVRLVYRRLSGEGEAVWMETIVMRQDNSFDEDVLMVAMSRSIDAQKAEEIRLQEQLWLQAEELRVTTGRMRRTICIFDVVKKTLTVPEEYAKANGIARVTADYPESMLRQIKTLSREAQKKIRDFYAAIAQGEPEGSCELCYAHPQDGMRWKKWEFATVYDRKGAPSRAVIFAEDITEQKQAQMEVQSRAERDGMTGLLNRFTTQERIRLLMAEKKPGILLHIDLDDLKTINDTYGHGEGDRALQAVAETLRQHFRESDVIGRIGGDEFLVYLPGAAENMDSISVSISGLLRKLTVVGVGTESSHRIHCSIGCAVQKDPNISFETLYKQADMALYHIKRSGKNNYAFYTPQMEQEDYRFKAQRLLSLRDSKKLANTELRYLPLAISDFYQLVMTMNLSTNSYYLMDEVKNGKFQEFPDYGVMDDFVDHVIQGVYPEDQSVFLQKLGRENLLQAYSKGMTGIRLCFRYFDGAAYRKAEATVAFYTNDDGDLCDFTLVRWLPDREAQECP